MTTRRPFSLRRSPLGSGRRLAHQGVALVTVLSLISCSRPEAGATAQPDAAATTSSPEPARLAGVDNGLRAVEDGLRDLPRDRWDPAYVAERIGPSPEALRAWVRDHTAWVPYQGVLRGPGGVLNDRLGSSLDRALLLATLLQAAGHEVRLAHAELPTGDARRLLADLAIRPEAFDPAPAASVDETPGAGRAAADYGIDRDDVARSIEARTQAIEQAVDAADTRVDDQSARLLAAVTRGSPRSDWRARIERATDALRDHWWVQRLDEGGEWRDLDLVADGDGRRAAIPPAETVTLGELTPWQHMLSVRVIAEQWSAGTLSERPLLDHALIPADLLGRSVVLQFWPAEWRADDDTRDATGSMAAFRAAALEQRTWDVGLVVDRDVVAQARFGDSGTEESGPKGGAMGGLAGAFGGGAARGRPDDRRTLSAVWIEYEIGAPGAEPRRIRREVFDLLGPAARTSRPVSFDMDEGKRLTRSLSLMMRTEILPMPARLAPEFVAHLSATSLVADRELLRTAATGAFAPADPDFERQLNDAAPGLTPLYAFALARSDWSPVAADTVIDRLNVLTRHRFPAWGQDGLVLRDATDIVANEVGVSLAVPDAFAVRLRQGVLDTEAERLMQPAGRPLGNTADLFARPGAWTTLVRPADVARLGLSEDARQRIRADLAAGYVVSAPSAPGTPAAWWRIDPSTGDTLGMAGNGWGQDMVERGVQYSAVREMSRRFVFDYLLCQAIPAVAAAARPMVTELLGTPSWVTPAPDKSVGQTLEDNHKGCLIGAIVSGAAFATLPLLLATLRYAARGVRAGVPPPAPPRPRPDLAKTEPDLGKTQPDLGRTQPDLGKTQPDLGKTQPDLGRTQPGRPPSRPSPPSRPDPGTTRADPRSPVPPRRPVPDKPTRADMDQAMKEHWDARERYYEAARDFIRYRGGDALTEQALFERSLQAGAESAEALNRFVDIARKLGIRTPRVAAPAAPGPSSVPGITGLEDTLATGGSSVADSWWSIPWPK